MLLLLVAPALVSTWLTLTSAVVGKVVVPAGMVAEPKTVPLAVTICAVCGACCLGMAELAT